MTARSVAFLGNHGPTYSTENHLARAFETNGHDVCRLQEGEVRAVDVPSAASGADLFVWVQTQGLADTGGTVEERQQMLDKLRADGIPTVGLHLDRWWGLDREWRIRAEPFFRCDLVCTADGGHQADFEAQGINHRWFPPGVSEAECEPGVYREELASDVAFVGSWQGRYHPEWQHRADLVNWLSATYRHSVRFWPRGEAVRGQALRDLYASVKVLVGDSCLVGDATHYASDRIPETLGRGGFLLHPSVAGVTDSTLYTDGRHLRTWQLGDWGQLRRLIDHYVAHDAEREHIAQQGRAWVLDNHTYEVRIRQVMALLEAEGLL